jgi:hypothetical protein
MIKEETNEKKAEETLATLEALATLYHNENNCCQWELHTNKQRIIALERAIFRLLFEINPTFKEFEPLRPSESAIKDATELLGLRHMKFDLETYSFCKQI